MAEGVRLDRSRAPAVSGSRPVPAISVVLPVRNGGRTIGATIASVLAQDLGDFELLVIDDGSTDDTVRIAGSFGDARIVVHSFGNAGLAASRNRGIRLARGDFIAFIDADDLWTPDKLGSQFAALCANENAALAYSWTDTIDERGEYLGPGTHLRAEGRVYERLLARNFLDSGSNAMVRAPALAEAGLFDESLPAAEDWDLWLRLAWLHPIVCVPKPQVLYRVHGRAMSSSIRRQEEACLRVFARGIDRLPPSAAREGLEREGRANLARYFASRVIAASGGPAACALALRYWWRYATQAPAAARDRGWLLRTLARIVLALVVPAPASRRLVAALRRVTGRPSWAAGA